MTYRAVTPVALFDTNQLILAKFGLVGHKCHMGHSIETPRWSYCDPSELERSQGSQHINLSDPTEIRSISRDSY